MDKQNVYVLIGLPGSGKTTWAMKRVRDEGYVIISRDSIRYMLNGNYDYVDDQQHLITKIAATAAREALKDGKNIIIDQVNINQEDRREVTDFIVGQFKTRREVRILFFHFVEDKNNVERRIDGDPRGETREYHQDVVRKMKSKFEPIESSENYDSYVQIDGSGNTLKWEDKKMDIKYDKTEEELILDEELWSLNTTIAKFIYPRLKVYRKNVPGYPGYLDYKNGKQRYNPKGKNKYNNVTEKRWKDILDKMILAFKLYLSTDDWECEANSKEYSKNWAKIDEGFNLFHKHFNGLWY